MLPARLRIVFQIYRWTLAPLFRLLFGLDVEGGERIPRAGPLIVVANHQSLLDAFVLIAALDIPIRYVITWDFYRRPLLRWPLWLLGTIPIGGEAGVVRAVKRVAAVLRGGGIVGLFPEGRISRDGAIQPFRTGAATLAYRHGATILAVHIAGSFEAMPRWARWPKRTPISFRIADPVVVPEKAVTASTEIEALTERIYSTLMTLHGGREIVD